MEFFLSPEVINVFNEAAVINGNVNIRTADSGAIRNPQGELVELQPFNPFTETPVQGVHWDYARNASGQQTFGTARNVNDYQLGRTFRISGGIRF